MPDTTDDAQARADRAARERRQEKLRATLDRKARDRADDEIRRIVDRLVRDGVDVPVKILPALVSHLPEICRDRTVASVSPMLLDAHHRNSMTRDALGRWIRDLTSVGKDLLLRRTHPRIERTGGPGVLAGFDLGPVPYVAPAVLPPGVMAVPPAIPPEDADALADLAP